MPPNANSAKVRSSALQMMFDLHCDVALAQLHVLLAQATKGASEQLLQTQCSSADLRFFILCAVLVRRVGKCR